MKKIFTTLLAAAVAAGCSNTAKYTITGNDEALVDGKYAYLMKADSGQLVTVDSVAIADNSFVMKGNAEEPIMAYLAVADAADAQKRPMMQFFLESGDIVIGKTAPEHQMPQAKGTPLNDKLVDFNLKMSEAGKQLNAAYEAEDEQKAEQIEKDFYASAKETVAANNDMFGVYVLNQFQFAFEPQEILDLVAGFPETIQPQLADLKQSAESKLKTQPGNPYINVVDKDADGKEISLESVVNTKGNKYVLLDFWASWCGPCMAELPYLKATYDKYHKKGFEIYGVSFDKDRDAWLKAVNDKKMNWIHVSSLNAWDNQARTDYAINGIPANFLIDCATGKIVATALRGEELQKKVGELLD